MERQEIIQVIEQYNDTQKQISVMVNELKRFLNRYYRTDEAVNNQKKYQRLYYLRRKYKNNVRPGKLVVSDKREGLKRCSIETEGIFLEF